eukprot:CAMPEP_0172404764 /NCGR_PEP_ID=MMETSP1061-20121228/64271_1 /TAXON_ID=37318 /ORGANISM="Pseudo-nitzschia pungens, Strain cf. pungens" /LENGTH=62 /DNA_ID=CAMNT_0013139693 /DNA_START=148 /DNA_END=333 /DNA_ORIENTATION=+
MSLKVFQIDSKGPFLASFFLSCFPLKKLARMSWVVSGADEDDTVVPKDIGKNISESMERFTT